MATPPRLAFDVELASNLFIREEKEASDMNVVEFEEFVPVISKESMYSLPRMHDNDFSIRIPELTRPKYEFKKKKKEIGERNKSREKIMMDVLTKANAANVDASYLRSFQLKKSVDIEFTIDAQTVNEDLLLLCVGKESHTFYFDAPTNKYAFRAQAIRLSGTSKGTVSNTVRSLMKMATHIYRLQIFSRAILRDRRDAILIAFAKAIVDIVDILNSHLKRVENQVWTAVKPHVGVLRILYDTEAVRNLSDYLCRIIRCEKDQLTRTEFASLVRDFPEGSRLLSHLSSLAENVEKPMDKLSSAVTLGLFDAAVTPWLEQLKAFFLTAPDASEITNQRHLFFDISKSGSRRVAIEDVPSFISIDLAHDLLEAYRSCEVVHSDSPTHWKRAKQRINALFISFADSDVAVLFDESNAVEDVLSYGATTDKSVFSNLTSEKRVGFKLDTGEGEVTVTREEQSSESYCSTTTNSLDASQLLLCLLGSVEENTFLKRMKQILTSNSEFEVETPLSVRIEQSLGKSLRSFCRKVNYAALAIVLGHHRHGIVLLDSLVDVLFLRDGILAQDMFRGLFEDELLKSHSWPPDKYDVEKVIRTPFVNRTIRLRRALPEIDLPELDFVVKSPSHEAVCQDRQSLHAFDFLNIQYNASQEMLQPLLTPELMEKYNRIFSHLVCLSRVEYAVKSVRSRLYRRGEYDMLPLQVITKLKLFAICAGHFVQTMQAHAQQGAIHATWRRFRQALDATFEVASGGSTSSFIHVRDLAELHGLHHHALDRILDRLMLRQKQAPLQKIITTALESILKVSVFIEGFASEKQPWRSDTDSATLEELCQMFFDCVAYFIEILARISAKGGMSLSKQRFGTRSEQISAWDKFDSADELKGGKGLLAELSVRLDLNDWWKSVFVSTTKG